MQIIKFPETVEEAVSLGYRITSRRWLHAKRIDRADWHLFMMQKGYGRLSGISAADQYRRVYSKDTIVIPREWLKLIPNSSYSE